MGGTAWPQPGIHMFFFNLRVFIKDEPQQEEQEAIRSKDTEFAAKDTEFAAIKLRSAYGVATVSRIDKIIGLFCS